MSMVEFFCVRFKAVDMSLVQVMLQEITQKKATLSSR